MTLLNEDVTSLSWECQCLFFFFLTKRKKKIIVKLMKISEAAVALQLQPKNAQGVSWQHHFPLWEKETCSSAAEPRHSPREGRFVPFYRNIFCCGGGCGAAFPDCDSSKTYSWIDSG